MGAQRSWRRRIGRALITLVAILALTVAGRLSFASDPIVVSLDQARLMRLPDRVATIIIGNPLIADVSVQGGGMLVITGKGYGSTNLVVLDRAGNALLDRLVQVQGPKEQVLHLHRGIERETYSCTPNCERRITLGDTTKFFDATVNQTGTLSGQAAGQAPSQPQPQR